MKCTTMLVMLMLWTAPSPTQAQQIPVPHRISSNRAELAEPAPDQTSATRLSVRPTQWKRGALMGGVGGAVLFGGLAYFWGCSGSCLGEALGYAPAFIIPGAFIGALVGGLFPADTEAVGAIRGPSPDAAALAIAPPVTANRPLDAGMPPTTRRESSSWKGAILIGVIAGAAFGLTVATQAGDEGSDRPFKNRLSDGIVAGAMLAVPVTVIFAMLTSGGS